MFAQAPSSNLTSGRQLQPAETIRTGLFKALGGLGHLNETQLKLSIGFINILCNQVSDSSSGQAIFQAVEGMFAEHSKPRPVSIAQNVEYDPSAVMRKGRLLLKYHELLPNLRDDSSYEERPSDKHDSAVISRQKDLKEAQDNLRNALDAFEISSPEGKDADGVVNLMKSFTRALSRLVDVLPLDAEEQKFVKVMVEGLGAPVLSFSLLDDDLRSGVRKDQLSSVQRVINEILPGALSPEVRRSYEELRQSVDARLPSD